MIQVTKLNMQEITINGELIEVIETTPDTVITMTTGRKFVVNESKEEIIERVITYKRRIMLPVKE